MFTLNRFFMTSHNKRIKKNMQSDYDLSTHHFVMRAIQFCTGNVQIFGLLVFRLQYKYH